MYGTCVAESVAASPFYVQQSVLLAGVDRASLSDPAVGDALRAAIALVLESKGVSPADVSLLSSSDVKLSLPCEQAPSNGPPSLVSTGCNLTVIVTAGNMSVAVSLSSLLSNDTSSLNLAIQQALSAVSPSLCSVEVSNQAAPIVATASQPLIPPVVEAASPRPSASGKASSSGGLLSPTMKFYVIVGAAALGGALLLVGAVVVYRKRRALPRSTGLKRKEGMPAPIRHFKGVVRIGHGAGAGGDSQSQKEAPVLGRRAVPVEPPATVNPMLLVGRRNTATPSSKEAAKPSTAAASVATLQVYNPMVRRQVAAVVPSLPTYKGPKRHRSGFTPSLVQHMQGSVGTSAVYRVSSASAAQVPSFLPGSLPVATGQADDV